MSLEDEKLTGSPDPVFKGLKASNKEKTLKRIARYHIPRFGNSLKGLNSDINVKQFVKSL